MTIPARRVQAYEATLVTLSPEHIERMHALAIAVGWSHRAEDLTQLLSLGEGVLAIDAIGRAIGSAMWFRMGTDMASIGMVMTVPPLQASGVGRWLTETALDALGDRKIRLVATRPAYHLDYSLGFRPVATVARYQGHLTPGMVALPPPEGVTIRALMPADIAALVSFDAHANGGSRRLKLEGIVSVSRGMVAERGGTLVGFGLCRAYGRGRFIGPLEACDETVAAALLSALIATEPEGFLRVDLLHAEEMAPPARLSALTEAAGLVQAETYTLMSLRAPAPVLHGTLHGALPEAADEPVMYAVMSQSLA
ncbi:N-acetyltransferase [Paenirhodobacter enshiensis]|uniref:N-acetyltransferase n=1 Tax=Paenirhodobacter enshiensis TaxID=1105367 RepID=UPI0035AEBE82